MVSTFGDVLRKSTSHCCVTILLLSSTTLMIRVFTQGKGSHTQAVSSCPVCRWQFTRGLLLWGAELAEMPFP